ncbi:MAG: sugar transferase [Cytophagales bacterium]|nr:sugar transferase [Armatimonadota bacterium]
MSLSESSSVSYSSKNAAISGGVPTKISTASWQGQSLQGNGQSLARNPERAYLWGKRLLDVALSLAVLVLLFPLLLLVGLAIVLEDGGPVLYYQSRVGRNGKCFRFYKFRSMVKNADALKEQLAARNEADGPIFKMKNDPRVTRVGRWLRRSSVDELPQFLNVLRGEMSLVGPRPHLPREVARYAGRQGQRLTVQPGLVCLREVCGRSNLAFEEWIELDLKYLEARSFRGDLSILVRVLPAVLRAEGAY